MPTLIALPNSFGDATTNMAVDASLLHSIPEGTAVFRHYGWTEPAVTFGYTQHFNKIKAIMPENIQLCRRLTGGGIVDHRNDWTYAIVLHSQLKAAQIPATELYATVHRCVQQALAAQSIDTQLAPCPRTCKQDPQQAAVRQSAEPNQCFITPTANDVVYPDGRKVAGAAMKRTRKGLLIQGSIERGTLPEAFNLKHFNTLLVERIGCLLHLTLCKQYSNLLNQQHVKQEYLRFKSVEWNQRR